MSMTRYAPPNDRRGFVHKRIGRAFSGFVTSGFNPLAAASGFVSGDPSPAPTRRGFRPMPAAQGPAGGECGRFQIRTDDGHCHSTVSPSRRAQERHPVLPQTFFQKAQALLPGGGTGLNPTDFGEAVMGAFGMPALVPAIVGQIEDHHGEMQPIRRCPRGSVLGKDDLCYNKIPNSFRKWPKKARAPVTASDAKCIRRAESARNRVKKLGQAVGFKVTNK